ncbi:hypothetical protein D3C73_991170 [compost metagenome]
METIHKHTCLAEKLLLHLLRNLPKKMKIAAHPQILITRTVLNLCKSSWNYTFRSLIPTIQLSIDNLNPLLIYFTEQIIGRNINQIINICQVLFSVRVIIRKHDLHKLHDPICNIVSAKMRIPVFIGRLNRNFIGHVPILNLKSAGG